MQKNLKYILCIIGGIQKVSKIGKNTKIYVKLQFSNGVTQETAKILMCFLCINVGIQEIKNTLCFGFANFQLHCQNSVKTLANNCALC